MVDFETCDHGVEYGDACAACLCPEAVEAERKAIELALVGIMAIHPTGIERDAVGRCLSMVRNRAVVLPSIEESKS